jgi:hypothetical protein
MLVTIGLVLGLATGAFARASAGATLACDGHGERGAPGSDAASPPEVAPDLDTGGEVVLPGLALAEPPAPPTVAPPALAPPAAVGRLHAVRLFRPPRPSTLA